MSDDDLSVIAKEIADKRCCPWAQSDIEAALRLQREAGRQEDMTKTAEALMALTGDIYDWQARAEAAEADVLRLRTALQTLVIDANRLCDRKMGGTYEEDCRRSILAAREALRVHD
jgi:hypothetical protein